jgi:3D (Asp-Asp-Asp) domain-containing protein
MQEMIKERSAKSILQRYFSEIPYRLFSLFLLLAVLLLSSCDERRVRTLQVHATAYNSVPGQTDDSPFVGAWGDKLRSEIKSIAISHDLIDLGITKNTKIKIKGVPGEFTVLDKMNRRWEKRIDIYMGIDIAKALEWGKKEVTIQWHAVP